MYIFNDSPLMQASYDSHTSSSNRQPVEKKDLNQHNWNGKPLKWVREFIKAVCTTH